MYSKGKSPSELTSYRQICLLMTLGKLFEILIVFRLTHFMDSKSHLHPKQVSFREDRSYTKALFYIMTFCSDSIANGGYTSLATLDIQKTFENVKLQAILIQLRVIGCPENLHGAIKSYLRDRNALINLSAVFMPDRVEKGCPQS